MTDLIVYLAIPLTIATAIAWALDRLDNTDCSCDLCTGSHQ